MFRTSVLACLILASGALWAAEDVYVLDLELWSRPREGEALVTYPNLAAAVRAWSDRPTGALEIRYPGGEEGNVWAEELRDWLVALGVPSRHIRAVPGSTSPDRIEISVVSPGAQ